MPGRTFVDTNILIYAHDLDAGPKRARAREVLRGLWEREDGVLSNQVLQEFYVNATRKIARPITRTQARAFVSTYMVWVAANSGPEIILRASEIEERHRLSFWDGLIVAAAHAAGAARIITEDFQHGNRIEGIRIENPFLE